MSKHAAETPANTPPPPRRWKPGSLPAALDLLHGLAAEGARPLRPAAAQLAGFAGPLLALFGQGAAVDMMERLMHADDRPPADRQIR